VYRGSRGEGIVDRDAHASARDARARREAGRGERPVWHGGLAQARAAEERREEEGRAGGTLAARSEADADDATGRREAARWDDPMARGSARGRGGAEGAAARLRGDAVADAERRADALRARLGGRAGGYAIPPGVPSHSWLRRGLAAPASRFDAPGPAGDAGFGAGGPLRPGRFWDGVDRGTGVEAQILRIRAERAARAAGGAARDTADW